VSADRFTTPLYGLGEAAGYLAVPPSALATWAHGYERRRAGDGVVVARPVITAVRPARRHEAAVPFIGLAEAYALAAFRQAGVLLQRIRPAIDALDRELGLRHALASRRLYTDGAEILYDYAQQAGHTLEGSRPASLWWYATTSGCSPRSWTSTCAGLTSPPMVMRRSFIFRNTAWPM
jgi:hypothetical protein